MATVGKMSVLTEKELRQMEADAKQYDYIRFSWPDMNGVLRGKTVIGRYAPGSIRNGVGEFTGACILLFPVQVVEGGCAQLQFVRPLVLSALTSLTSDNWCQRHARQT